MLQQLSYKRAYFVNMLGTTIAVKRSLR